MQLRKKSRSSRVLAAAWENKEQPLGNWGNWIGTEGTPNGTVFSISWDEENYSPIVAGSFDSIGNDPVRRITVGTGIQNGVVYSTVFTYTNKFSPLIFAGGTFTLAGGTSV